MTGDQYGIIRSAIVGGFESIPTHVRKAFDTIIAYLMIGDLLSRYTRNEKEREEKHEMQVSLKEEEKDEGARGGNRVGKQSADVFCGMQISR